MLPKRKLIKKRHIRPQLTQEENETQPRTLVERLRSIDNNIREQALTHIASMCAFSGSQMETAILVEMITVLYQGNNSLVYQCLFALANLCEIEETVIPKLFQMGLDKALVQLNSADKDLLKPIMVLMIALHDSLPEQFRYLQKGVESSLTVGHLSSSSGELVLQFLVRMQSANLKEQIYQKLYVMFKEGQKLKQRSSCLNILLRHPIVRIKIQKEAVQFCDEIINDIDLNLQYNTNIVQNKPQINMTKDVEGEEMEQEGEQLPPVPVSHVNYETFTDAVEAVEILLEGLLTAMEDGWEEEEFAEEENEQIAVQKENIGQQNINEVRTTLVNFFTSKTGGLIRSTTLCFMEGQNIVNLALRLLSYLQSLNRQILATIILKCFSNIITVNPPAQILSEVLNVGLYMLMKCPLSAEGRGALIQLGQKVLQLNDCYRDCWISLLELYSIHFNPEKGKVVQEQNLRLGLILKRLIVNIPCLQLEQWRAQTIDTLFDIYSNQQFDVNFVQLGLMQLLRGVQQRAGVGKKKRFIKEVLADINRFLEYKRKMIKF